MRRKRFLSNIVNRTAEEIPKPTLAVVQPHNKWSSYHRITSTKFKGIDQRVISSLGGLIIKSGGEILARHVQIPLDHILWIESVSEDVVDVIFVSGIESFPEK